MFGASPSCGAYRVTQNRRQLVRRACRDVEHTRRSGSPALPALPALTVRGAAVYFAGQR